MTVKPVAFKTKLGGLIGRLEVDEDSDIGDEVAFVAVGVLKARNVEGTDAGPVLTVGIKASDFHRLPTELADDLILSVKRHGRARTMALNGNRPIAEDADDALGLGETPDEVVDRWLAGHDDTDDDGDLELEDDLNPYFADEPLADDIKADIAADEPILVGDPMPRRPSPGPSDDATYVTALEAAWAHIDRATPGYADQSETERKLRTINHQGDIAPWSLRQYLLIEIDELAGSEPFIKALEDRHRIELERITKDEPWPGYAKATVDAVIGRLDSRKASDEAAGNRESMLEHVEVYELSHKGRKGVLGFIAEERIGHNDTGLEPDPDIDFEPTANPDADPAED